MGKGIDMLFIFLAILIYMSIAFISALLYNLIPSNTFEEDNWSSSLTFGLLWPVSWLFLVIAIFIVLITSHGK